MITEYRPVTWTSGEPVSEAKLATMTSNDQFLFESLPKLYYNNGGIKKDRGIKVFATVAGISPTTSRHGRATVYFGDTFSVGCRPVVSLSLATAPRGQFHLSIAGIGQTRFVDHRGVEILASADELNSKENRLPHSIYAHIIAIGF